MSKMQEVHVQPLDNDRDMFEFEAMLENFNDLEAIGIRKDDPTRTSKFTESTLPRYYRYP